MNVINEMKCERESECGCGRGSWAVRHIVEYVRQFDVCFDVEDVLEDVRAVLALYGVCAVLKEWELKLLRQELVGLAEREEFREVSRVVLSQGLEDGLLI
ncbi:MAG: hypothetical protein KAV87_53325 [Desulfobacteraceae bacterium]|nr:hypothetical protein [Desulfobacteraceae bacterium]